MYTTVLIKSKDSVVLGFEVVKLINQTEVGSKMIGEGEIVFTTLTSERFLNNADAHTLGHKFVTGL